MDATQGWYLVQRYECWMTCSTSCTFLGLTFVGNRLRKALLRSCHSASVWLSSGFWRDHCNTLILVFFSPSVVDLLLCSGSLFIDSKVIWYTEKFMVDLPVAAKQARVIIVIIWLLCSMLAWAAVCGPRCCAWHSPNLWFVQMQFRKTMLVVFFLGEEALSRQPFQNEPDEIGRFLIVLSWILAFSMLTEACGFWDIGFAAGSLPWMDLLTSVWSVCPLWIIVPTVRWCLVSWHSVSTHLKLPKLLIL